MPTLLLGIGIVGASVLLAVGGLLVVRRVVPLHALRANHEVAPQYLTMLGLVYGLVLAFALSIVWSEFNDANAIVEREAGRLVDVARLAGGLPPPAGEQLRTEAVGYARAVVDEEWTYLAGGEAGPRAAQRFDALWRAVQALQASDDRQAAIYEQVLIAMQDLGDLRQERLARSRAWVPPIVWALLIVGGLVTVGTTYFFGHERTRPQALMTGFLAGTLGAMLFLIVAMDNPFWGDASASPLPFEEAIQSLGQLEAR